MKDTLLIVAGDCGFGFDRPGYYENTFNRNASRLSKSNNWILMVRGNHDDPAYFREERISHSRFRTVPDYSMVQACGHNILCAGGAVSIDREYRKDHDYCHPSSCTASYWKDEMPVYDDTELGNIDKDFLIDTGHPLSHWYYGHFHQSWNSVIDGVLFSMLDIMEFKELR